MIRIAVGAALVAGFPLSGYAALSHKDAAGRAGARAVAVKAVAPSATAAPIVSGTAKELQVLTSSSGSWSGTAPITLAYQWQRCAPVSRLTNGGFEADAAGWAAQDGAAISQSTTQAHTGTGALKVVTVGGSANGQGAVYRFAAGQIQAGHNYRFSVWVGTTGPATVATAIRFYNSAGAEVPDGGYPYITTLGWNLLGIRLTAPAGATSGLAEVTVAKTATTFYVDDATFTDCSPVSGATAASYTVQAADAGSTLASLVTASNSVGSSNAMSDMTAMALDKFDTAPAYTGPVYSDNTSAAAGDPPAPPPITTTLPTWRNLYNWPNGHGYVGWHYATSATDARYGADTNHGGNYGLWLWPVGGQQYTPNYAEWTYTAPGTTRISTVNLTFAYRNKFLAHHCLQVGLRTLDGTIVSQDTWCKPALPPDSQRDVQVKLADPKNDPSAKVLFFRVEFPACADPSSSSCSKYIPQLDPLTTGANARLKLADMILVDDDNPLIQPTGPLWDIRDHFIDGTQTYPVTLGSAELGSGIVSSTLSHASTYPPATGSLGAQNAPCDAAHNTPPLDNRICPATFSWDTSVPTPPYPEGPNAFTETATDSAGNVGSQSWTIYIDRTQPDIVDPTGPFYALGGGYIDGTGTYSMTIHAHDPGREQQKASGINRVWVTRNGGGEVASSSAPCTALICPDDYTGALTIDTTSLAEGANTFTAHASDLVGHSTDGPTWTVYVDRTAPTAVATFNIWNYNDTSHAATVGWEVGGADDPQLPTGEPGSGVAAVEYRYQLADGEWSSWTNPDAGAETLTAAFDVPAVVAGAVINVEVRETDQVGNVGPPSAGTITVTGSESNPTDLPPADAGPTPSNDVIPIDPPAGVPVDAPVISDDDPRAADTVDNTDISSYPTEYVETADGADFMAPLQKLLLGAGSSRATSGLVQTVSNVFDENNPCAYGTESVLAESSGSTTFGWREYGNCFVFFNSQGNWTIYKRAHQDKRTDPSNGDVAERRNVGPGYIAIVRDTGHTAPLVNDFRWRKKYTVDPASPKIGTDVSWWNPGNLGATNGGLGTFEVQYVRGPLGATYGGQNQWVGRLLKPLSPPGPIGAWGPDGLNGLGFLSERYSVDEYPGWGVYHTDVHTPVVEGGTIRFQAEVWIKDPSSAATGTPDGTALMAVQHLYKFSTGKVDAIHSVKIFGQQANAVGWVPMVKEPKFGAAVRASGRFTQIQVFGRSGPLGGAVTRGQPEWQPFIDAKGITHSDALNTQQSAAAQRIRVEWQCASTQLAACGTDAANHPCAVGCFDVTATALNPTWVDTGSPSHDPFAITGSRPLWQSSTSSSGTPLGLDGWARNSAGLTKAWPQDTDEEGVSNCSKADPLAPAGQTAFTRSQFLSIHPGASYEQYITDLSQLSNTAIQSVRRWELGGWKNGTKKGGYYADRLYTGSFVMFHGWEGAAGPKDCEPLLVPLGSGVHVYSTYAQYSVVHG